MAQSISRLQFLRGDWEGKSRLIRPPSSQTETHFKRHCTGCRDCIEACPSHIIQADKQRYPYINFRVGECDFCGACAKTCPTEALSSFEAKTTPDTWLWRAEIKAHCLSLQAVFCRSCAESCEKHAIRFQLKTGGIAQALLDQDICNGCGACLSICPVKAIHLSEGEAHVRD